MRIPLAIYEALPDGTGYWEKALAHIVIHKTPNGLTEELARKCMAAFVNSELPKVYGPEGTYDPRKIVVGGTFGDLGTLYVRATGEAMDMKEGE